MQNKANLLDTQMSVSSVKTKYYENKRLCSSGKNKPKQTQLKALKNDEKSADFFKHLAPRICYNTTYLVSRSKGWGRVIWRRIITRNLIYTLATTAFLLWPVVPAFGLILHPDGEPNLMSWTDRPPEGVIGRWGSNASCVAIGPNYVITTRHQGGNLNTPVRIGGVTYTISQIWNCNTADLRIAKLNDANLPNFVGVYGSTNEAGKNIVLGGYGVGRGELLQNYGITYGYKWGSTGNTALRMGTNKIEETENDSALGNFTSDIIIADFDGLNEGQATIYESNPANYDSGGGWFIKVGSKWKIAGLSRAVGIHFEEGHDDDPNYAIYDETWFRDRADPNIRLPDYLDAVRISSYAQWIKDTLPIIVTGDLNGDGYVNFADFAIFDQVWLNTNCQEPDWCLGADFEPDGDVDWADLAEFINHWLRTDPAFEP